MTTSPLLSAVVVAAALAIGCSDDTDPIASPTSIDTSVSTTGTSVSTATSTPSGCSVAAPADFRVISIDGSTVELTWAGVPGAFNYTMIVGTTPGGRDVLFANTSEPVFRFTAPDGRSFARVEASTACGTGPATGSISFEVP
jgi:hypothetical protein